MNLEKDRYQTFGLYKAMNLKTIKPENGNSTLAFKAIASYAKTLPFLDEHSVQKGCSEHCGS